MIKLKKPEWKPAPLFSASKVAGASDAEIPSINALCSNLSSLSSYHDEFVSALSLFDVASNEIDSRNAAWLAEHPNVSNDPSLDQQTSYIRMHARSIARREMEETTWHFEQWKMIAFRAGAMAIFHFGDTLDGLLETLESCPALNAAIDLKELESASALFEKYFGKFYIKLRHSISHDALRTRSPTELAKHELKGPGRIQTGVENVFVADLPVGRSGLFVGCMVSGRQYSGSWKGVFYSYELSEVTLAQLVEVRNAYWSVFEKIAGR